jgi:two-component system, NarL family, invasion response regulator UvrY
VFVSGRSESPNLFGSGSAGLKGCGMTRILIADDHAVVRRGISCLLAGTPDLQVAGEAQNAREALALARNAHWDLVLLDIGLPDGNGLDVLKQIKAEKPGLPILIFSMSCDDEYVSAAFDAGASAYLAKDCAAEDLLEAIRRAARDRANSSPKPTPSDM